MEMERPDNNPKSAYGVKKPPLGLIPSTALVLMAEVMKLGAAKYTEYNWRYDAVSAMVYLNAAERHMRAWLDGEDNDDESGVSHLAHAMSCFAIILDAAEVGKLIDDRPPKAPTGELIRRLTK